MRIVLAALVAAAFFATPSHAQIGPAHFSAWDAKDRGGAVKRPRLTYKSTRVARPRPDIRARLSPAVARTPVAQIASAATQMLPHPAGCPRTLFCACGAAVKLFGTADRKWWHTSAWRKFPRAAPASGMVAVNGRHIFVIDKVLPNGMVMAYDYNSGGNASRYHARSLAGYEIRNPRG